MKFDPTISLGSVVIAFGWVVIALVHLSLWYGKLQIGIKGMTAVQSWIQKHDEITAQQNLQLQALTFNIGHLQKWADGHTEAADKKVEAFIQHGVVVAKLTTTVEDHERRIGKIENSGG